MPTECTTAPCVTVETFVLGPWETNCYVVRVLEGGSDECWIIDAGFEPSAMIEWIQREGLRPTRLILTHGHLDHIAGVPEIRAAFGEAMILSIHEKEADFLNDPALNMSLMLGMDIKVGVADEYHEAGQILALGSAAFEVFFTPGHSPGGVTLYQAESGIALVGDTLFADSIGRSDFPTSDGALLFTVIRKELFAFPPETVVYPGHGPKTTIGVEQRENPFVGDGARYSMS